MTLSNLRYSKYLYSRLLIILLNVLNKRDRFAEIKKHNATISRARAAYELLGIYYLRNVVI